MIAPNVDGGTDNCVGPIVGFLKDGTITGCYVQGGSVKGALAVGGLVGSNAGTITNCYSTASVRGDKYVGGLAGYNSRTITNCYSTGTVEGVENVGGLVGLNETQDWRQTAVVSNCFWDTETSRQATSAGGTGKTTAQMQTADTFFAWGICGNEGVWTIDEGKDYPRLRWENKPGKPIEAWLSEYLTGEGTQNSPYLIYTLQDLHAIAKFPCQQGNHFRLMADIDLDPNLLNVPIFPLALIPTFAGVFDGSGHTISHLTIKGGSSYVGLFGQLASGAEVKNIAVVDVNVGGGLYVGGLVGYNSGSVTGCYSTAAVIGGDYVGGLVGSGSATRCYSAGAVSGGGQNVGGLTGSGGATACFWDTQTSGRATSAGGTGKTTAEMQMASTFLAWGCTPAVWTIDEGVDYPRLAWEGKPGKALLALADFLAGYGGQGNPYLIWTGDDLNMIGVFPGDWDKHFKLMADIDLSGFDGKDGRPVFKIIGTSSNNAFTGVFDGNGHTISHLTITGGGYLGLFGYLGSGAEVRNLAVADVNVAGSGSYVGGLAGYNYYGSITTSSSTGTVSGSSSVGGLVGRSSYGSITTSYSTGSVRGTGSNVGGLVGRSSYGSITTSYSTGSVSGGSYVGGLVGYNSSGSIDMSYSTGAISGDGCVGGLVGSNGNLDMGSGGPVTRCYSNGAVSGTGSNVGGLVGWNYMGNVTHCYSTGAVRGSSSVGGLVADNWGGTVIDCYSTGGVSGTGRDIGGLVGSTSGGSIEMSCSTGAVSGNQDVGGLVGNNYSGSVSASCSSGAVSGNLWLGGLVGWNDGTISMSYSAGSVSGNSFVGGLVGFNADGHVTQCYSTGTVSGNSPVGGLVGLGLAAAVSDCFWDTETSGQKTSGGGTGLTTAEMKTASTFLQAGWDFVGETIKGTEDIWGILEGKDYPRFAWEFWATSADPSNGAAKFIQCPALIWVAARGALAHDIYFGEELALVADATSQTQAIYRGRQAAEMTRYDPGVLELGKTYYWRIDEVNEADPNSPWKGSVWSFTTVDYIVTSVVDDFESYTDDVGTRVFQTWKDGRGYTEPPPGYPGNGTGSTVGYVDTPFAEQVIVHGGRQSMPFKYNNVSKPWYSEAERTWETPQDWTVGGADTLTLYFRGWADNGRQPLYVGIEDSAGQIAVVVHPDADVVLATEWQKWHIALADVKAAGVDVAAVKKMVIGFGDRKNPQPGGTGTIYIDDIRLTKRHLVVGDFDGDGHTDFMDFCILAEHWLTADSSFWCGAGGSDLTNDGKVDLNDLRYLAENWLAIE